jgi:hypothetical protein
MNWKHFALAVVAAGVATSLTDWFFMGVLFHEKYGTYPEIWRRPAGGRGETQAIAWSVAFGFFSCVTFVGVCALFDLRGYESAIELALAVWLIGSLPMILMNAVFIKYHPLTVVAHSIGWLVRLVATAAAVGFFMPE